MDRVWMASGLVNTCRCGEGLEALCLFPTTHPMLLFRLADSDLYPFIINQRSSKENISLSSMSCSSKFIESKGKVFMGTSDL